MNLPPVKRVVYDNTSLDEVVCQFRFPTILKIGTTEPVDFQEEIRRDFPIYRLRQEQVAGAIPEQFKNIFPFQSSKVHDFLDESENTQITLTQDFIALTTKEYGRFEKFRKAFQLSLKTLKKVYNPTFYTRLGLRYVDIIDRKKLKLNGTSWSQLLSDHITGELGGDIAEDIVETNTNTQYKFEWGSLKCRNGLRTIAKETCFYIDNDFFCEGKFKFEEINSYMEKFNEYERTFFRYCISDKLHEAMGPRKP